MTAAGCFKEHAGFLLLQHQLEYQAGKRGWASASDRPGLKYLFHHYGQELSKPQICWIRVAMASIGKQHTG